MIDYLVNYFCVRVLLDIVVIAICMMAGVNDLSVLNDNGGWLIFLSGCIAHYMSN